MASEIRPQPATVQGGSPTSSGLAADFPQFIPPVESQRGRNLILCFDGTGDQFDQDNSNIVRFVQLLKKDDRTKQMVYYQAGIGTKINNKMIGKLANKVSQVIDTAIATGLGVHVRGGYEFLMQNYTEGDRISLFGFSRGAYTARALAGMLQKVGLLPAYNHEQVPFAYAMFKRDDPDGWKMSNGFKRAFSIDVKIDFLGVFDTVSSVGIIPRELPFAKSNYLVRVFRHAVALDERRAKFKANMWGRATAEEEKLCEDGKHKTYHRTRSPKGTGFRSYLKREEHEHEDENEDEEEESKGPINHRNGHDYTTAANRGHKTNVKEVWFAGAHCDVGGGSVSNDTMHNLARIPLRWMIRECFANDTGIIFHSAELDEVGLSPASLWPTLKVPAPPSLLLEQPPKPVEAGHAAEATGATLVGDAPPSKDTASAPPPKGTTSKLVPDSAVVLGSLEDTTDAEQDIYDQLSIAKWWWILEVLPMRQRYQRHDKTWSSWFSINFGGPRKIHGQKRFPTYVHRSVQYRMQKLGYNPRAEILEGPNLIWVD